jgi:hypothetical protein
LEIEVRTVNGIEWQAVLLSEADAARGETTINFLKTGKGSPVKDEWLEVDPDAAGERRWIRHSAIVEMRVRSDEATQPSVY